MSDDRGDVTQTVTQTVTQSEGRPDDRQIATVRRFARTVTARLGVLDEHWQGRGRPLNQSRLLFELRDGPVPLTSMRTRLGLDSGYASRLVHALADAGLLVVADDEDDARARHLTLTAMGQVEVASLDEMSDRFASGLVAPLDPDRRAQLVDAMRTVTRLLDAAAVVIDEVDPFDPRVLVAQQAYVDELATTFPDGFVPGDLAADLPRYQPPHGSVLLVTLDDEVVGTVALAPLEPRADEDDAPTPIREVKRMWVAPAGRGLGLGRRLLTAIEGRATALGTATIRLDTNETLGPAIALYESAGYEPIQPYSDNPYATHFMQRTLAG